MGLFPEKEPKKNVIERPDEASPLNIERKEVATPIPTQFKAQVKDDNGQPVIQTPQEKVVTVVIPDVSKENLEVKVKEGNKEESLTWRAAFWLRQLVKAIFFGKKVEFKA